MPRVNSAYEEIRRRDEQIGRNIKSLAAKIGLNTIQLADRICMPQSSMYHRLQKSGDIRVSELYKIAKALGVSVNEILE
ncbi:MAG: helix-turn-helix domain-containing protein [Clostridium sp.]|jgi:predicted transcriptional regulator|nr:helix-turn-helix domain-containing protein [Clostridium sp.]